MTNPVLHIGNRNYSSWSMRPWLALTWAGVAFETRVIDLGPVSSRPNPDIAAISPTGMVPLLEWQGERICDSLAICAWAAERATGAPLWPEDPVARAHAWSAVCEMHAGFARIRADLPMNIRRRTPPRVLSPDTAAQVARVDALWSGLHARFGAGTDRMFATASVADAMFTPVATRFRTYGVPLSPAAQTVCDGLLADPAFKAWEADALAETWTIPETDAA
jgi:glutathione S-transferase